MPTRQVPPWRGLLASALAALLLAAAAPETEARTGVHTWHCGVLGSLLNGHSIFCLTPCTHWGWGRGARAPRARRSPSEL